jgi:hypothetical protein
VRRGATSAPVRPSGSCLSIVWITLLLPADLVFLTVRRGLVVSCLASKAPRTRPTGIRPQVQAKDGLCTFRRPQSRRRFSYRYVVEWARRASQREFFPYWLSRPQAWSRPLVLKCILTQGLHCQCGLPPSHLHSNSLTLKSRGLSRPDQTRFNLTSALDSLLLVPCYTILTWTRKEESLPVTGKHHTVGSL